MSCFPRSLLLGATLAAPLAMSSSSAFAAESKPSSSTSSSSAAPVVGGELAAGIEPLPDGILIPWTHGVLQLQVCADHIVRVLHAPDRKALQRTSLMRDPKAPVLTTSWKHSHDSGTAVLTTPRLTVRAHLVTGRVAFFDAAGNFLTAEREGGTTFTPAEVLGTKTLHVQQRWESHADEALFGLGHHQLGLMDIKGHDLDLWQHNGTIAVPFLSSSRGYGILWDNNAFTRFGDLREAQPLSVAKLVDATGSAGGLTASYFSDPAFTTLAAQQVEKQILIAPAPTNQPSVGQIPSQDVDPRVAQFQARMRHVNRSIHPSLDVFTPVSVRWEGSIVAESTGVHTLHAFSNNDLKVWLDDRLVINHWRQGWLAWKDVAQIRLNKDQRVKLRVEWVRDETPSKLELKWKTPAPSEDTSLWSEMGEGVDYYFVHGRSLDEVIAGYRQLTGAATLLPKWAFGLWQSRQRYETQQESLDVVAEFRKRGLPLDVIVQDWMYWPKDGWGSHEFDKERFPEPQKWIDTLHHDWHAKLLISVWPKFYPGTKNFEELKARGFLYQPNLDEGIQDWIGGKYTFYDAFNPAAREVFWSQINRELFSKGADAWWLDGSEPDLLPTPTLEGTKTHLTPTAAGSGASVVAAFPLENTRAVYEGQRSVKPDQRVAILTRSGFAGQQRFAGAVWSGDTSSTWTALAKQVPAALGLSLSGLPYWTMDIGGFSVPHRFNAKDPRPEDVEEWRELNTRWFQFGAFTPMLRVHGERPWREMWFFGDAGHPAYETQRTFARLHYRLLPYIYSVAGAVTHEGGSFLRPLVMDFPDNRNARDVGDQYLFGPSLMVSPVTTFGARKRRVLLPDTRNGWYDFWTGKAAGDGLAHDVDAPYETIPVHVKAGAIIPFGPEQQWVGEKATDPLTLYVYAGANGTFTLYEDDGASYGYERGECTRIPLTWADRGKSLTIGARIGSFPGMLTERTIHVVFVTAEKPVGFSFDPKPDRTVKYTGEAVTVKFE